MLLFPSSHPIRLATSLFGMSFVVLFLAGCVTPTKESVVAEFKREYPDANGLWTYFGSDAKYHYFSATTKNDAIAYERITRNSLTLAETNQRFSDLPAFDYYYEVDAFNGFIRSGEALPVTPKAIPPLVRTISPRQISAPRSVDAPLQALTVNVDLSPMRGQHPELAQWAQTAAELCRIWYPIICRETEPPGIDPPHHLTLIFFPHGIYPAFAFQQRVIVVNATHILEEPTDYGMIIHEMTHIPQDTKSDLGWLAEGIADYVRWVLYEHDPSNGSIRPGRSAYHDGYRTTAAFLDYLVTSYDPRIVLKCSELIRKPGSSDAALRDLLSNDPDVPSARRS